MKSAKICAPSFAMVHGWRRGLDVIRTTNLKNNPIYAHIAAIAQMIEVAPWYRQGFAFAVPGNPDNRKNLTNAFLPPLVLFDDGRWTETSVLHVQGKVIAAMRPDLPFSLAHMREADELAQFSEELLMRHRRFAKGSQLKAMQDRALGF